MLYPTPSHSAPYDQLLAQRPRSHQDGLLPAQYLSPGETLLYSTRPSFVGYALPQMIVGIAMAVVLFLFEAVLFGLSVLLSSGPGVFVLILVMTLLIAAVAGPIVRWWFACYAVTTTRILVKIGASTRRVIDIPHGAVQSVLYEESAMGRVSHYGTLQFSSASVAGFSYSRFSSRPGVITWLATPYPLETRAFYDAVRSPRPG
jgi:membrane protein YdbS with pleckstrin-like domain